jgi:hypothetical protein
MKANFPKNHENILDKMKSIIMETDIWLLSTVIIVSIFVTILTIALFFDKILMINMSDQFSSKLLGCSFVLSSLLGLIYMIRGEIPGPFGKPIRGFYAVLSGLLILLFFGFGGIFVLFSSP